MNLPVFWRRSSVARLSLALVVIGAALQLSATRGMRAQTSELAFVGLSPAEVEAYEQAAFRQLDYLPNQVVVKFKQGVSPAGQQRALMALRSRPDVADLKWVGAYAIHTDRDQANGHILAQQLSEQPEVELAQPNYLRRLESIPNDPSFATRQWNMTTLDMARAWDINPGAEGVIVAVVDSGVTNVVGGVTARTWNGAAIVNYSVPFTVNPDLPVTRLVSPRDFVGGLGSNVLDMSGHGTHVSGTVGEETNNGVMLSGVAYKTRIMPVKVCASYWDVQFSRSAAGVPGYSPQGSGGCPDSATAPGIRYAADNGAKVINFSIGGSQPTPLLLDAINYAVSKGVFVAIASGNSYEQGNPTNYPAKYAETINGAMAVGSVARSLKHAYYSSSGAHVEVAAPGGDQREAGAPGGIWQSSIRDADSDTLEIIFPRFDRFEETSIQGTSMASPHVAGIAALLYSQLGTAATPALVEQIIKSTARPCSAVDCVATNLPAGRTDFFGAGLIQPRAALFGRALRK